MTNFPEETWLLRGPRITINSLDCECLMSPTLRQGVFHVLMPLASSDLKNGQQCRNEVRVLGRQPGERADMPSHSLTGQKGSEESIGRSVALWPCGPDARQTRSLRRSNQSPGSRWCLVEGRNPEVQGLVDEALCPKGSEKAHKPSQR